MASKKWQGAWRIAAGIAISVAFIFLAARNVQPAEMLAAFGRADGLLLPPALAAVLLGLFLRALRWRLLLLPLGPAGLRTLFASLSLGYMANTFMPAHLGEFVRAWHAARRTGIRAGSVLATVVVERIVDVASLLALLAAALLVFPFPSWVRRSGALLLALVVALSVLLALLRGQRRRAQAACSRLLRFLPGTGADRAAAGLEQFLCGLTPLRRRGHYAAVAGLSLAIWACYALTFQFLFHAFGFVARYRLPWSAALVVLVVTTISVVVPSSPGYVGTFHFLCQLALGFFQVPRGPALSYAVAAHAFSVLPPFLLGLWFLGRERLSLKSLGREGRDAAGR